MKRRGGRRSLFKLGNRGRRGRQPFDEKWHQTLNDVRESTDFESPALPPSASHTDTDMDQTVSAKGDQQPDEGEQGSHGYDAEVLHDTPVPGHIQGTHSGIHDNLNGIMVGVVGGIRDSATRPSDSNFQRAGCDEDTIEPCTSSFHPTPQQDFPAIGEIVGDILELQHPIPDDAGSSDELNDVYESNESECVENSGDNREDGTQNQSNYTEQHNENHDTYGCDNSRRSEILRHWKVLSSWQNLLGVLLVSGSVRFSVQQYEIFRSCINPLLKMLDPSIPGMPSYSKIRRTILPLMRSWSFIGSDEVSSEVDKSKSGAKGYGENEDERPLAKHIMIKPSSWSIMDVQCKATWEILSDDAFESQQRVRSTKFRTISESPIVLDGGSVLDVLHNFIPHTFDKDGSLCGLLCSPRSPRAALTFSFRSAPEFPAQFLHTVRTSVDSSGNVVSLTSIPVETILVGTNERNQRVLDKMNVATDITSLMERATADLWREGDVCTLMKTTSDTPYDLIFVHHQARPNSLSRRMELILLKRFIGARSSYPQDSVNYRETRRATVKEISSSSFRSDTRQEMRSITGAQNISYGTLSDGTKYFVDRILLYSDGFSQYGFKQGSAGGVYSISLSQHPFHRRSRSRVRVLTLTPPGVSTSQGLGCIISDLVESCTRGVKTRTADGDEVVVFTEVVGYVCDYHEVSHLLDVLGSSGNAPCHLCSFSRFQGHHTVASSYAYTTEVHSADPCFARTAARTDAIRSNADDGDLNLLGMRGSEQTTAPSSRSFVANQPRALLV